MAAERLQFIGAIAAAALLASVAAAQRVQIPATGADPFGVAPLPTTPAPVVPPALAPGGVFDPYATSPLGPPPATVPYSYTPPTVAAPALSQPSFGGQPLAPQPFAPSAPAQGFGFGPPAPPAAPPSAPLLDAGLPFGWESGTYEFQRTDGVVERYTHFLRQLSIENTFLFGDPASDPDELQVNELEIASTFSYPLGGNLETPLLITPGFRFNFFEGPVADPMAGEADLPPVVYDAFLDASWFPQPLPSFGADLGFRVGVFSDFDFVNSDSVRFLGRGLGVLSLTPRLDLVGGIVFLDRLDISILPAGGFRYRPNDVWDFYAVFPSPRATRRLRTVRNVEIAWFFAGEYGGGSWTAERGATDDRFDYNDIRVTTGFSWETPSQRRGTVEVGYVFDRELIFASGSPASFTPDDTVLLRAGIDF